MPRNGGPSRGCQLCRQRKIKCDETVPKCQKCVSSGRECPGPLTDIFVQDMTSKMQRPVQKIDRNPKLGKPHSLVVEAHRRSSSLVQNRLRKTKEKKDFTCNSDEAADIPTQTVSYEYFGTSKVVTQGDDHTCHTTAPFILPSAGSSEGLAIDSSSTNNVSNHNYTCIEVYSKIQSRPDSSASFIPVFCSPRKTLGAAKTDPFGTLAIQLNKRNEVLIHHYIHVLGPSAGYKSIPLLGPSKKEFDPQRRFWLPLIFSDIVFLHAMLAAAAAHRSALARVASTLEPAAHNEFDMLALFHKAVACCLINEQLTSHAGPLNNAAISAVLYMVATELIAGVTEQVYIHFAGLYQMVRLRGGIQTLPRILAFSINFTDAMLALQTLERPQFPLHSAAWQNRSAGIPQSISNASASRLLHSDMSNLFSGEVLEIFQEVVDLANQFDAINQLIASPEQLDDLEYRCVSIQYRLLSYDYKSLVSAGSSLDLHSTIQMICLLATLIFFASGVWRFPDVLPETAQLSAAVSLTKVLLQQLDLESPVQRYGDALLWVSFYAGFTARGELRQFFVTRIKKLAEVLAIGSFGQVQDLLDLFLYREKVFGPAFLALWQDAEACSI